MHHSRLACLAATLVAALALGGCTAYGDQYGMSYGAPPPGAYGGGYGAPVPQGQGYDQGGYDEGYDGPDGYDQGYDDGNTYAGGYYGNTYDAYDAPYYPGGYYGQDYGYGFGWYDGFYYPGFGVYIYDRGGHRHGWRNGDRNYWSHHPRRPGANLPQQGWQGGNWHGRDFSGRDAHGGREVRNGQDGARPSNWGRSYRGQTQPGQAVTPQIQGGQFQGRSYYRGQGQVGASRGQSGPAGRSMVPRPAFQSGQAAQPRPNLAPAARQWSGQGAGQAPRMEAPRVHSAPPGTAESAGRRHPDD